MAVGQHHGPVGEGVLQPRYEVHHSLKLCLRIVVVPRMHPGKDWHLAQMTPLERGVLIKVLLVAYDFSLLLPGKTRMLA